MARERRREPECEEQGRDREEACDACGFAEGREHCQDRKIDIDGVIVVRKKFVEFTLDCPRHKGHHPKISINKKYIIDFEMKRDSVEIVILEGSRVRCIRVRESYHECKEKLERD